MGALMAGVEDIAIKDKSKVVRDRLVLPVGEFFPPLDAAIGDAIELLKPPANVFRGNLESAFTVVTIPFVMTYKDVLNLRFQALFTAEKIRARKYVMGDEDLSEEHVKEAHGIATARMHTELSTDDEQRAFQNMVVDKLHSLLISDDLSNASHELLLETMVMLWGAFEVFVTDTIKVLINSSPGIAVRLVTGEKTKKHFPSKGIPIEVLADRNFNVGSTMGNILFDERHFDSFPIIKDVLMSVFLEDNDLCQVLSRPELWLLSQRRHVIVHRRGVVDASYISKTGDKVGIGTRLQVASDYIYKSFDEIRDVAISILRLASSRFDDPVFRGFPEPSK
jgi:hypothetical protein